MLICIDFQPSYEYAFSHLFTPLKCRLRKAARRREAVQLFYNESYSLYGEELGDPVDRVLTWCQESRLALKNGLVLRKNFGWVSHAFRDGVERAIGVSILRCLLHRGLANSAELTNDDLREIIGCHYGDIGGFQMNHQRGNRASFGF